MKNLFSIIIFCTFSCVLHLFSDLHYVLAQQNDYAGQEEGLSGPVDMSSVSLEKLKDGKLQGNMVGSEKSGNGEGGDSENKERELN